MAEADGLQGSGGLITILDEQPSYKPRDAVTESIRAGCITGGFGILLASVQNTLARQNYGAAGVFTKFGGTIGLFGRQSVYASFDATNWLTSFSWIRWHLHLREHRIGKSEAEE